MVANMIFRVSSFPSLSSTFKSFHLRLFAPSLPPSPSPSPSSSRFHLAPPPSPAQLSNLALAGLVVNACGMRHRLEKSGENHVG